MRKLRWSTLAAMLLVVGLVFVGSSPAKSNAEVAPGRYLVIAKSAADYEAMRGQVQATGAEEVLAMPAINTVVVVADVGAVSAALGQLARQDHRAGWRAASDPARPAAGVLRAAGTNASQDQRCRCGREGDA